MTELSPETRTLIGEFKEAARRTPEERAAMRAAITAKISAPPSADPPLSKPAGVSVAWVGLAAFVLVLGGGLYVGTRPSSEPARTVAGASVVVAPALPSNEAIAPSEATVPSEVAPPSAETPVARATPPREPTRALPPEDPAATLRDELTVLREANAAVREGRFGAALSLLSRFSATHTGGTMGEERAATRVVARCGQRTDERTQRDAQRFLGAYPRSPQATRIRRACGL